MNEQESNNKNGFIIIIVIIAVIFGVFSALFINGCDTASKKKAMYANFLAAEKQSQKESSHQQGNENYQMIKEKAQELKKHKQDSIIKEMRAYFTFKKDEFKDGDFIWVEPKNKPHYDNRNILYCYFSIVDGVAQNFRMALHYAADDWLFINSWIIRLDDGLKFQVDCEDPTRDNNEGGIWELCDVSMTIFDQSMLGALEGCHSAKIKMIGADYQKIRPITAKELKYIQLAYSYYCALGGKLNQL